MADAKKRLGRGVESLLSPTRPLQPEVQVEPSISIISQPAEHFHQGAKIAMIEIPIDKIVKNPHQPRQHWDEEKLRDLSNSIKGNGLIQPIVVRPMGSGFQLIAGERRLKALHLADETTVTAIVRDADEEQMLQWSIIENIHRADLNPLERAQAYQNYIERFKLTQLEAAERLGENRSSLNNYMRLLDLSRDIKRYINEGKLSMGHARALLGVDNLTDRDDLAGLTVLRHWSVRDLEKEIQRINNRHLRLQEKDNAAQDAHIHELETELTRSIGSRVTIKPRGRKGNRGKIIIEYNSFDDFDRIQAQLMR